MLEYNVYCDESCHLERDRSNVMVLGAVYCPQKKLKEINKRIIDFKEKYGINPNSEIKWTKISELKKDVYLDIIDYFFDDDDLSFRAVIADKTQLNHEHYRQTHDQWYYKIYFNMLKTIFDPMSTYNIYVDIKDTHSYDKSQNLLRIMRNNKYDFSGKIIRKIQPIRSNEVQIMQITDILIGALAYENRTDLNLKCNVGKLEVIKKIKKRSGYELKRTTLSREPKMNILKWESKL